MGILSVAFNNIIFDDVTFDENDPETIIHVRLMPRCNRFKQQEAFKKDLSKELMPLACHLTRSKMVGLVHVRRREKRNRANFY